MKKLLIYKEDRIKIIVPHTRALLGAYLLNIALVLTLFFLRFINTFHAQLLHTIAFNFYAEIEKKISKACDAIYDGWYSNCI